MRRQGTTTVEIKSGYGLTVADEARALRIACEFTTETTYLGAHVVPPEWRGDRAAYVDLVAGEMLAACAPHARWIDVFCEPNSPHAFDEAESRRVLAAGVDAGLMPCVHGNQLGPGPGSDSRSSSVRRVSTTAPSSVQTMSRPSSTRPTRRLRPCCPGSSSRRARPIPTRAQAHRLGVSVAIATDCNPGTCYSSSMPFMIALAVREMRMSPAEAVQAATGAEQKRCAVAISGASRSEPRPISVFSKRPVTSTSPIDPASRSRASWGGALGLSESLGPAGRGTQQPGMAS